MNVTTSGRRTRGAGRLPGAALALTVAVASGAALAGCGDDAEPGGGGGSGASREAGAASLSDWREPADYAYTLTSSCGERSLIGTFRVTVEDGDVTGWEPVGENYAPRSVEVPSIGDLLAEAEAARERGADSVEVETAADGRPTRISVDEMEEAIDDEACYDIEDVEPVPAS
ncbi:DUF6174 domain-containing protein [Streptomyces sp. 4N509B]|uniref:DUF6174 domain-containing protein n=1 Tax=Streptomyces sp. 4N509B TaxID=3457413 RepID=UPI003FD600D3